MTTVDSLNKNPPSAVLAVAKSKKLSKSNKHLLLELQGTHSDSKAVRMQVQKQDTVRIVYPVREDEAR